MTKIEQQINGVLRIRIAEALAHFNREYRVNLTMAELSKKVILRDISDRAKASYLSIFNKGDEVKKIKPEELKRLAEALEVSSDYLIGLTDEL